LFNALLGKSATNTKDFDKEWWKDKECYRCGKKGHPASACSVKPLSDNDDKSICSSKLASNVMAAIQKSTKTMGKAMTQLGETANFDDELFEEQLHAQLGVVSVEDARSEPQSVYAFATRTLMLRNHLLLDNQSSVHIMCNPDFVNDIRESSQPMILKSNGGSLPINEVANFEGFKRETWFLRNAMTNILSCSLVKSEYNITYDGDAFIIHWAAKGYSDMVFKPHKSGLHVYDLDDPRGLASYSFMETVESNMALFTKRQIHGANLACNLQAGLAFPSNPDMKWAIRLNLIKDCPVTIKDMGTAIKVWGPNIAMLKGKTVRAMPPVVRQDVIEILKQIMSGEVVHYNFFAMGFGRYCQIHEEDQPRNNLAARTQGAISLGPSGNAQGGHKFFTLTTGKVVV
jgi:hypothetical protein